MLTFVPFFGQQSKQPIKSRVTDVLWIPVLACIVVGYIVIAAIDMNDCVRHNGFSFQVSENRHYIVALSASLGSGLLLSLIYMLIVHKLVSVLIVGTLVFYTVLSVALTVYYGVAQDYIASFVSGLSVLGTMLILLIFYRKIKKATKAWARSVHVSMRYPSIFLSAIALACFSTGVAILSGLVIFAGHSKLEKTRSFDEYMILVIYVTIGAYLMICFGKVVSRSSVSCVYGYWYFTDSGPTFPLFSGFKQAITFSLGSLCATCIILTAINVCAHSLAFSVDIFAQMHVKVDMVVIFWGASTFMMIFDWFFQILSLYTTIFISIYNCTYLEGTQRAIVYLGSNFINEALTGGIFMLAARSVGMVSGLIAYIYLRANDHADKKLFVSFVELAATQLCSTMISPIIIGVQTLCVLEEESKLRESLGS